MNQPSPPLDRYARQMQYPPIGEQGQRRLLASRVLVCGCGALGSVLANTLARAGVGHLRIVDRDLPELNNLQRQVLYDEDDVAAGIPKAVAAQRRLRRINSQVDVEAIVADLDHQRIISLLDGVHLIVDGTDNFDTRFLINDAAIKFGLPWVFGGCVGAEGQTMTILPGETPCLRCLLPEPPPPGTSPTSDVAGILAPIVNIVASWEACEAIKILSGHREAISRTLTVFELWDGHVRQIALDRLRESADCPACHKREFPWLEGAQGNHTSALMGRNAVHLSSPGGCQPSLQSLAQRWQGIGRVTANPFLLRLEVENYTLTVFPDRRAIIHGTEDIAEARAVYAKYVG